MSVVVITGATAGVGRATARAFAKKGARLGLIARNADALEDAKHELEQLGARSVLAIPTDVADAEAVEQAATHFERALGPIDVWINNAMVTVFGPAHIVTPDEYKRVTEVTYLGTVNGTLAALSRMRRRNKGTIVQVGSALSYRAIPLQSAYCGAKFAVRGFTDSVRCELLHDRSRIRISMVQLPAINTPQFDWARNKMPHRMQPMSPVFSPDIAARAIVYAARHKRREIIVGLSSLQAIIGNKLFPGLLDRILASKAYSGQQTNEPAPQQPNNLFEPPPIQAYTDGRFTGIETTRSRMLWLNLHRGQLTALAGGFVAATFLFSRPNPPPPRVQRPGTPCPR